MEHREKEKEIATAMTIDLDGSGDELEMIVPRKPKKELRDVTLWDFQEKFLDWCEREYGGSKNDTAGDNKSDGYFTKWLADFQQGRTRGRRDFRTAVAAHRDWLWNQTYGMSQSGERVLVFGLWGEIGGRTDFSAIKKVPES